MTHERVFCDSKWITPSDISVHNIGVSILGMMVSQAIHSISNGIPQTEASEQPVIRVTTVVVHCAAVTTVALWLSSSVETLLGDMVKTGLAERRGVEFAGMLRGMSKLDDGEERVEGIEAAVGE
ncbi:hypothetical protein ASPNIDRAFT_36932 [Aspergillus niger ATCC 1015]|uniref:Uncharacterized protein n=1 Tax=Aspergillus niger (strain ATCC 1015 / CBS 113.46 / FGSC A1144 / LSHB Ac4 / NCTC 3858a / NRRL 328 / USDA 3528.7) TaxID=380704 RepID=G3Y328_ASPNA|nr:hypothetical protein ASPNIDRAFT_36932 [Aspergillus niger ATCC 1015]